MIVVILILFFVLILIKMNNNGKKLDISVLFDAYWLFFLTVGYISFTNLYEMSTLTFCWICSACILFGMGYRLLVKNRQIKGNSIGVINDVIANEGCANPRETDRIYRFLFILFSVVFVFRCITIVMTGRLGGGFSLRAIFDASREMKYGEVSIGVTGRIMDMIFYPCVIILGKIFCSLEKKRQKKIIPMFLFALLSTVMVDGAKAPIVFSLALFLVGFVGRSFYYGGYRFKELNINLIVLVCVVFCGVMLLLLRNNVTNLVIYGFGEVPAFDWFFKTFNGYFTFGKQTFWGLVRNLDHTLMFNGSEMNYALPDGINLMTNVYTVFRCTITDFGYIGGLMFYFLLGLLAGITTKSKRKSILREGIMNWILGFIFLSFMMSIGFYFTISLSMFLAPFYYSLMKHIKLK